MLPYALFTIAKRIMSTDVIKALIERRSVRAFKDTPIPTEQLHLMLKSMEAAPSAGNIQPWSFYVISNSDIKEKLCETSFNQTALIQAPLVIGICAKPEESAKTYQDLGRDFFCVQDTACVAQNLQLAAYSLGYGSVWIGIVKKNEIRDIIGAKDDEVPVALIALGVADEEPGAYERRDWQEITTFVE